MSKKLELEVLKISNKSWVRTAEYLRARCEKLEKENKALRTKIENLHKNGVGNSEANVCPKCESKNTFYAKGDFFFCKDCKTPFD